MNVSSSSWTMSPTSPTCSGSNSAASSAPGGSRWNSRIRPRGAGLVKASDGASLILMFSDINMPGMTGLELLPLVREARPMSR